MQCRPTPPTVSSMIGHISGSVVHHDTAGTVVSCGGVGYLVHSTTTPVVGDQLTLWVSTVVREDAITLYGFPTRDDQSVFTALRAVSGIGPAIALGLVRDLGAHRIADAVKRQDVKALSSVRGVGAKAAERIVSMVKLPDIAEAPSEDTLPDFVRIAVDTLVTLGIDATEARASVQRAHESGRVSYPQGDQDGNHSDPVAELVTLALGRN